MWISRVFEFMTFDQQPNKSTKYSLYKAKFNVFWGKAAFVYLSGKLEILTNKCCFRLTSVPIIESPFWQTYIWFRFFKSLSALAVSFCDVIVPGLISPLYFRSQWSEAMLSMKTFLEGVHAKLCICLYITNWIIITSCSDEGDWSYSARIHCVKRFKQMACYICNREGVWELCWW